MISIIMYCFRLKIMQLVPEFVVNGSTTFVQIHSGEKR